MSTVTVYSFEDDTGEPGHAATLAMYDAAIAAAEKDQR